MEQSNSLWWRFVNFSFRLLYHEMASSYDLVSWAVSLGQWRAWQRSVLKYLPKAESGLVLEIAHGTGNLQLDLQAANYRTIAYDFSAQMGQIAKTKLQNKQITVPFVQGMAQDLPFADETFMGIVCTFPTNFITQAETLSEAYRVLKPNGIMIVVLNGVLTGGGVVTSFLEWLYTITGQRTEHDYQAEDIFGGYGFQVETVEIPYDNSIAQLLILRK
jgi:ubiquinone/menaquinone biosynthesis C-methylase UbiE